MAFIGSFVLTAVSVRQQRSLEGYRVEVITNSAAFISADMYIIPITLNF